MSEKLDIETDFDKFKEDLKGCLDRKFDNSKYLMCVVTYMEDTMKTIEQENMPKYLYKMNPSPYWERKGKSQHLQDTWIENDKIEENMNKIYGVVLAQCTPSLQSVLKRVPGNENKSKYRGFLWLMEELNKITTG